MANERISIGRRIPKISEAAVVQGRSVQVTWDDGRTQRVDLMPAFASHRGFVRIRDDDELFHSLRVGEYGGYLEWADGSELSAVWLEELADGSLDNAEFRDAMDKLKMSLDGMAARLGIARRLIADYRKDKPIPKPVALATRYLLEKRRVGE